MSRNKRKLMKGQPVGARSLSGRKRDRTPLIVAPCMGVERRKALMGVPANDTNTCDAIGRAYVAGLLHGAPDRALELMNAGRKIATQYWRVLGFTTQDSLARFQPSQPSTPMDPALEKLREDAFNVALSLVDARGRDVRRAFDHLVIDPQPDSGPPWLDRIIYAQRRGQRASEGDYAMLRLAVEGLSALA